MISPIVFFVFAGLCIAISVAMIFTLVGLVIDHDELIDISPQFALYLTSIVLLIAIPIALSNLVEW